MIISLSVFELIVWLVEVIGALSTNKFNGAVARSLVGSMEDVVWMIDELARRDAEVEMVGKIVGKLAGAEVGAAINATEGRVAVVELIIDSILES